MEEEIGTKDHRDKQHPPAVAYRSCSFARAQEPQAQASPVPETVIEDAPFALLQSQQPRKLLDRAIESSVTRIDRMLASRRPSTSLF